MNEAVADTHAVVWHLLDDARLSQPARALFEAADQGRARIWIPTIVLVEVIYLVEKMRLPSEVIALSLAQVKPVHLNYPLAPLTIGVVESLREIERPIVPDMPDRIIAATALHLGHPLMTCDSRIRQLPNVEILW